MTRNPYVVDPAFHTEDLFDMFKKKTKKATPVVQEQVGKKTYFDVLTEDDMKRESEGREKNYSHEGSEAIMNKLGNYACLYQEGEILWRCITTTAPTGTQSVLCMARKFMKGSDHVDVEKWVPCRGDDVMWHTF